MALGKVAIVSGIQEDIMNGEAALDGDLSTRWASKLFVDPGWMYVDLGYSYDISRVVLKWEAAYAEKYEIQVSNDEINWTTVYATEASDGETEDIEFETINARFVKVFGTKRATKWGYSLWEFEIY